MEVCGMVIYYISVFYFEIEPKKSQKLKNLSNYRVALLLKINLNKMLEETDEKPPEAQGIGHPPNNLKDELIFTHVKSLYKRNKR